LVAKVRANWPDLHGTAQQLSGWHTESNQIFDSGHATIEDATSGGWVGDSQVAMQAALERMRRSAGVLADGLGGHAERFHDAARTYHGAEDVSRDEFA
jgi:uncharacterized protein YukE